MVFVRLFIGSLIYPIITFRRIGSVPLVPFSLSTFNDGLVLLAVSSLSGGRSSDGFGSGKVLWCWWIGGSYPRPPEHFWSGRQVGNSVPSPPVAFPLSPLDVGWMPLGVHFHPGERWW